MNLADFGMLLGTISGGIAALGAARVHGVGWPVVFFILLGLVVGAATGIAGNKLSYAALARSGAPIGKGDTIRNYAFGFIYMLIPLFSMAVAASLAVLITVGILSLTQ